MSRVAQLPTCQICQTNVSSISSTDNASRFKKGTQHKGNERSTQDVCVLTPKTASRRIKPDTNSRANHRRSTGRN